MKGWTIPKEDKIQWCKILLFTTTEKIKIVLEQNTLPLSSFMQQLQNTSWKTTLSLSDHSFNPPLRAVISDLNVHTHYVHRYK